ncbi:hypothetical protein BGW37DRAFT_475450 [Umbelopsis sp. PMI_123]|nr:hypothetical protein BGW37DRAFT_475450 [Umbelopsis sp. PMI_123]
MKEQNYVEKPDGTRNQQARQSDPNAKPYKSCGRWDHEIRSSKFCPNHIASRREQAVFHRPSIIKTSLQGCCRNDNLQTVIRDTMKSTRTITYLRSLFFSYSSFSGCNMDCPSLRLQNHFSTMFSANWRTLDVKLLIGFKTCIENFQEYRTLATFYLKWTMHRIYLPIALKSTQLLNSWLKIGC